MTKNRHDLMQVRMRYGRDLQQCECVIGCKSMMGSEA